MTGAMSDPDYPRYLEPGFTPFDPLDLARETEKIVCRGDCRKYTKFYCTGVYGGIATGYTCGCCLRCVFCWVDWSRDFPERHGTFRSPSEASDELSRVAHKAGVSQLRISGAEPTLGKNHLLGLLEKVENSPFRLFILETNGVLIGADHDPTCGHPELPQQAHHPGQHLRHTSALRGGVHHPDRAASKRRQGPRRRFAKIPHGTGQHGDVRVVVQREAVVGPDEVNHDRRPLARGHGGPTATPHREARRPVPLNPARSPAHLRSASGSPVISPQRPFGAPCSRPKAVDR